MSFCLGASITRGEEVPQLGSELLPPLESPTLCYSALATPGSVGQDRGGLENRAENRAGLRKEHAGGEVGGGGWGEM